MRVAIFAETFLPKWDGVAHTTCRLLEHLAARGVETLMFAPEGAPAMYAATPIIGLPWFAVPFYPELRLAQPRAGIGQELAAFQPDLVHLINPALMGLAGLKRARALDVPVVASYHTDIPGYLDKYNLSLFKDLVWSIFRWIHNQADLNLCPTPWIQRQLAAQGFARMEIWGRGVDCTLFRPDRRSAGWRERLTGGHPHAPLLIYAGRLAIEKRVDVLRPVLDRVPGVRLAILGDGPERSRLEAFFAGSGTVFTGKLSGEDLAAAYAAGDIFAFPGENETFGNVVLEAMASGLPCLVAAHSGLRDRVRDGRDGFLFEAGNSAQLATLVRRLVEDRSLRDELGRNALAFARTQTWQANLDGLLRHYERVAAARLSLAAAG